MKESEATTPSARRQAAPGALRERGYAFALPRLLARLGGGEVRRAELSRWEAYGLGILVFSLACVLAGHLLLPLVRPVFWRLLALFFLPFAVWVAFLLFFYLNALLAGGLRRLGLYRAVTNNPFQHFVIIGLTSLWAVLLIRTGTDWMCSLGVLWLGLLALNLLALGLLKLRHES